MTMETMEILANENIRLEQENQMLRELEAQLALDVSALAVKNDKLREALFPLSHEACDAFWEYWKENGETHKHGYYESTWGAIRAYLAKAKTTENQRAIAGGGG